VSVASETTVRLSARSAVGRGLAIVLALLLCAGPVYGQDGGRTVTWRAHPPSTHGVDAGKLAAAVDRADDLAPPLTSLLVARDTTTIAEIYFGEGRPGRATNLKSASKSILSALVGIALEDGALDRLDRAIGPFFPELLAGAPRKQRITVRNLLTQQAGLESTSFGNYGAWVASPNWVADALRRPFVDVPGGEMIYSTGNTHVLGAVLAEVTGQPLRPYAQEHLFDPLGVRIGSWQQAPTGRYFGGNNLSITPRALLRVGQLYLNDGRFRGKQVLPPNWPHRSWKTYVRSTYNDHQYGYLWFTHTFGGEHVAFAWGYGGQYLFAVPRLNLIVVMTSSLRNRPPGSGAHNEQLRRLLGNHIIPAARGPGPFDSWPPLPQPVFGW